MSAPLYLDDAALAGLGVTPDAVRDSIAAALTDQAENRLWTAPKAALLPGDGRYVMATLATGDGPGVSVVKSVMVSPGNPGRGLPAITGSIMVLDAQTGLLRAVLDAGWVTGVRTAGLSALAARALANPQARSVGFIGAGVQARSHLDAFRALFPLSSVKVFGRGSANVDALLDMARAAGLEARAAATARAAVEDVDIVVTSVTLDYTIEPFLDARWLRPGCFAAITDLAIPWHPEGMAGFGRVYVDDIEQERAAEKPMVAPGLIAGDLGSLAASPPGFDPDHRSAFIFRGMAIGDFAVAALAVARARATGAGQPMG